MLVGSTNQVFFKAFTLSIPVGVHECNMCLGEQKFQLLLRWADRTAYIWRPMSDFRLRKDSDFPEWLQSHTRSGDVATLDAKISARIRYGNLAHVSDGCRQKHCIQNCGQKLQIETVNFNSYCPIQRYRQLLTTYRLATMHLLRLKRLLRDDIWYPRLDGRL